REQINVKMRNAARCGWHFAPTVNERPTDTASRPCIVPKVARKRAKKESNVLIERVDLIPQGLARTEEITPDLAVHFQQKTSFGFVVSIVSRKKIGEQLSIFINGI